MEELAVKFYDSMNITKPNQINPECLAEYFDIDFEKDKKKSLYAEFGDYKLIHVSDQCRHSSGSHWHALHEFAHFLLAHKEGESVDSANHRSNEREAINWRFA